MKRGEEGNVGIGQKGEIKTPDLPIDQQGKYRAICLWNGQYRNLQLNMKFSHYTYIYVEKRE